MIFSSIVCERSSSTGGDDGTVVLWGGVNQRRDQDSFSEVMRSRSAGAGKISQSLVMQVC